MFKSLPDGYGVGVVWSHLKLLLNFLFVVVYQFEEYGMANLMKEK